MNPPFRQVLETYLRKTYIATQYLVHNDNNNGTRTFTALYEGVTSLQ